MLVLLETAAGYALFKVLDEGKLKDVDNIYRDFQSVDTANKVVKLKAFSQFNDTTEGLAAATACIEGKMPKALKKFLQKNAISEKVQETIAVADTNLGKAIKEKLNIDCISDSSIQELFRCMRMQLTQLITGMTDQEMRTMALGLAHSLSRYKLKFSPDKVDTMVVQAIGLLDDLDKELNNYAMRLREWFGWHFPELNKIITDNLQYANAVKLMGTRIHAKEMDFQKEASIPESIEQEVKTAAEVSMGTDITETDVENIRALCDQVIRLSEYRASLAEYLANRMNAIAPNLTYMVGELVAARLIAHAGSLMNLAKYPASTVQILGAEKALFRALKTKHETPKYGLIYHASLVGQTAPKFKGKISRVLAAKLALSVRVDAMGDQEKPTVAVALRTQVENRQRQLEGGQIMRLSGAGKSSAEKYTPSKVGEAPAPKYDTATDMVEEKKDKKKKKVKKEEAEEEESAPVKKEEPVEEAPVEDGAEKKKKKKKKEVKAEEEPAEEQQEEKTSKKRKESAADAEPKKKKKKVKHESDD